jgi:hypothetical protein
MRRADHSKKIAGSLQTEKTCGMPELTRLLFLTARLASRETG